MQRATRRLAATSILLCLAPQCSDALETPESAQLLFDKDPKLFPEQAASERVAALGRELFHDARISSTGRSCATCHDLRSHGQNGATVPVQPRDGAKRSYQVPTVLDASRLVSSGWSGQRDLASMIRSALHDPARIGVGDAAQLLQALKRADATSASGRYEERFRSAFGKTYNVHDVERRYVEAIAAYLSTLRTRGRWDRFVEGDTNALTHRERRGLEEFVSVGCAACHASRLLGGVSTHRLEPAPQADEVRAPPLRLAAHTAPYFHDGSAANLPAAIRSMGTRVLKKDLTEEQVRLIQSFLQAVGDLDA